MPRKKRKSSFQSKPSLLFTESPVNIVKNVLSPVMCARYPPTATSVPINELEELTWVSPQFSRVPSTGGVFGKRRPTRQRRSLSVNGINKENTIHHAGHNGLNNKRNKFKSLKFLSDRTVEESMAEEVNISFDSVSNSDVDSGNDAKISEQESPSVQASIRNKGTVKRNKKRFSERLTNINFDNDLNHSTPRPMTGNINLDNNSNLNESSVLNLTKLKPKPILKSPVKRLFACQINSCDIDDDIGLTDDDDGLSTIPSTSDGNSNEVDNIKESDISSSSVSDVEQHVPNSESDLESNMTLNSNGARRSLRIQMLRKLLEQGVSPEKDINTVSKIIVPDTPEEKYGWPLKKYQIREYFLNKR